MSVWNLVSDSSSIRRSALCQVISYKTIHSKQWIFDNFLPRFSQMLKDPTMHVRKLKTYSYNARNPSSSTTHNTNGRPLGNISDELKKLQSALHIFGDLGRMFGQKFTEVFLVPHLITLSCDMTWAVRKVACEIFVKVAECASRSVRAEILSPNFVRLLNDPNKWVSFIAYQQLGPFIALFADGNITGLSLFEGQIIVREPSARGAEEIQARHNKIDQMMGIFLGSEKYDKLPPNTWLPEADATEDFEYQLAMSEALKEANTVAATTASSKTPKRGERVMDSVISGINKMFGPFERSSPKSKEVEKIAATFSSPSKNRSPLSLHGAVSLMDKWSKRSNPNNPQRFPVFDPTNTNTTSSSGASSSTDAISTSSSPKEEKMDQSGGGTGIAAKCNSTDDLTKLGLEDDAPPPPPPSTPSEEEESATTTNSEEECSRTTSPRGRRIATSAWSKLDIRQKLFLRRLGALPPSDGGKKASLSPRLKSPTRSAVSPSKSNILMVSRRRTANIFDFADPVDLTKRLGKMSAAAAVESTVEKADEPDEKAKDPSKDPSKEGGIEYMNTSSRDTFNTKENDGDREADANEEDSDDDSDDFDKSFVEAEHLMEEDAPLTIDVKTKTESVSMVDLTEQKAQREPVSNEFSLTFWSSNYAISSIEDELKPFGSSSSFTNSPTSNSYLESRFDVMKPQSVSPRARSQSFGVNGSPIALSPRRKANSTSEEPLLASSPPINALLDTSKSDDSIVMLNTEEKEKLGILDIDEMNMSISSDNSSMYTEAGAIGESDVSLTSLDQQVAFPHVPADLVESYMKVMGPNGHTSGSVATGDESLCAEIYRHCAHNFPAICYTLGRAAWPRLNLVFRKLAMDEQARVRQSISYSIHEIANMLGQQIADEDLLPVFYDLRNDQNAEVRAGILTHLYDFVKCLSLDKRDEMILSLPQFFPIGAQPGNQAQNGDWRSRFELISQLSKLCSLYSIQDVNLHMSGIALTLADDRVAEVRREAVMLVSTIVGALVSEEWEYLQAERDIVNGHVDLKGSKKTGSGGYTYLSEQFVDDIISSFAKTQKWTRRQTFCFICAQILRDKQCNGIQFRYFFSVPLLNLVHDKVANVRLASCEAMSVWRKTLIAARSSRSPYSSPSSTEGASIRRDINLVSDMMVKLTTDSDIDAAFLAKKCQGLTDDQQPVDVEARTNRMREREQAQFQNVVMHDEKGNLVRCVGKTVIAMIKEVPAPKALISVPVETAPEKEAPLQSMDEFDCEIMNQTETTITTPPEVRAEVVQISEDQQLQDNTEVVDMEIEEEEEETQTLAVEMEKVQEEKKEVEEEQKEKKTTSEEVDVPMDPAPSLPQSPKSTTSESTTPSTPTTTNVIAIPITENATSPEDSDA
ncbi:hypothetical protein L5515_000346 [Caenorhabditis briggsae]|uniref:Protein CBR-PPFR-1 n=1 Tax=Caenorhabditis briggsae TaxID=6238 RepID=A0AAE9J1L5_CAEBR|nr:hypothetical protein L5515_000346 [Caenorhabditis briggsae]